MKRLRNLAAAAAIAVSSFAMSAQAFAADVVDTAVAAGNFKTLVAAVQAAGLVDTLKGAGPFTVFAPTDEAFAKLPAGNFKTLVAAVQAAGLVDTLKGAGPFTVFAPTDEAFAKLPAGTVEMLLKPENKDKLVAILTYHVVPGKVMAADVAGKEIMVKSVQGSEIDVNGKDGVMVDNAKVIKADIVTDNGVIHVIDAVIMPKM